MAKRKTKKKAVKKTVKPKIKLGTGQTAVKYTTTNQKRYKYNAERDAQITPAKRPGKRKTKWGTVYYETRVNRSDAKGSLTGTNFKNFIKYKNFLIDKISLTSGGFEYWILSPLTGQYLINCKTLSQAKKYIDRTIYLTKLIDKNK